jgi:hypothetical protein
MASMVWAIDCPVSASILRLLRLGDGVGKIE